VQYLRDVVMDQPYLTLVEEGEGRLVVDRAAGPPADGSREKGSE